MSYGFAQDEPETSVAVTNISGEVMVQRKDTGEWEPIAPGNVLSGGDTIKTLPASKARLQFPSGSVIEVNENTLLSIEQLARKTPQAPGGGEVFLLGGRIKATIEKLQEGTTFRVKTPTAIAGVRGTIFYVNVVSGSERILTGFLPEAGGEEAPGPLSCSEILDLVLGIKECYAQPDGLYTELFVEQGFVNFTNIFSNISYMVGADNGSFAGMGGDTGVPQFVPPNKRDQWKSGFGFQAGGTSGGGPTKKGLKSTTGGPGGGPPGGGLPPGGPDGLPPDPDPIPKDPGSKPGSGETSANIDIQTSRELREELVDLHNDVADITDSITLAELDARLAEIQDAQDGKVMRDRFGTFTRSESYVLRPADNKVAIMHLVHRRTGDHSGVASTALEVTFNRSLAGADLKNDIPWTDIMSSGCSAAPITYSSEPSYYPIANTSNFDPTTKQASMVLTLRNPYGDYNRIYEGFGDLTPGRGVWQQAPVTPLHNMNINGTLKNVAYGSSWVSDGGTGTSSQTFSDGTFYSLSGYVIDNDGNVQNSDTFTDGTSQGLSIKCIRNIYGPKREHNLELTVGASELGGRTIDVIVAPEVTRPYTED